MAFLNPLVLFGLAAAAIPLIIHLFNFRRPKKIDFSSLAFLKELQRSTMQRVRIKQWLLLLLRTFAIACLVLAFARPTLEGDLTGSLGGRVHSSIALVLDNSLSMTLRDTQGEYLEQARDMAAGLVDRTEPGDELFILPTASTSDVLPSAYKNHGPALDALADITVQPGASNVARALERAATLLQEASHPNREIYLLSDLQRSTLLDSIQTQMPHDVRVILLPVGDRAHANVAITEVRVTSRIVEVGQAAQVEATLTNHGTERLDGYVASLYLEGERVAQATADLNPGVSTPVRFAVTPQARGWLAGLVQIEDDAFEHDNLRYFALHVPERRRLLMVRGEGQQTQFVELALSSQLTRGRVTFDLETIDESTLTATTLGTYDAVVLVGPRDLSSGEVASLTRYIDGGGGVLFFPSEAARAPDYNALFGGLGGGTFSGFSGSLNAGRSIATFDRVDLEHPLFEGVFEQTGLRGQAEIESPEVYYAMNYTPSSGTEQTLIQLSSGFPFMQEIRYGRGAAFILTVAPTVGWSDLPVRGLFIPLLYRSIYYLSSSESVQGEQLVVGKAGELRLTGIPVGESLRLVAPDGEEITPEQRSLFGAVLLQTDASLRAPGLYDIRAGQALVRRVALNLDSRESDLNVFAPDEAATRLAAATGLSVRVLDPGAGGAEGVVAAIEAERTGVELWNVFLLVALLFMIAEMLVSMQWRPEAVPA
ncbi:MAG: BatA domain-containing protein [Rhodothermales bacterium]